jgi:hypothetical protein
MRVQPRFHVGVVAVVVYAVLVVTAWGLLGVDYTTISSTTENVLRGIVVPVGAGAVFLAGYASWLGWWQPALRERERVAPRWTLVVPALMVVTASLTLVSAELSVLSAGHLAVLAVGTLLVGFSEELLTRGLLLVGFRGSVSEALSWFWTSFLFGLIHAVNLFFGQSALDTMQQVVSAFLFGSALYVTRMATGALVAAMLVHAFWDFASLSFTGSGAEATTLTAVGGILNYLTIVLALVSVVVILRARRRAAPSGSSTTRVAA